MFITVRFGDRQEAIFNPNCKTRLLLDSIKRRCNCHQDIDVDLSDELGNVKNLQQGLHKYANELLEEREKLVLLKVDKIEGAEQPNYTPLLNDREAIDSRFLARLSSRGDSSRPETGRAHRKSGGRKRSEASKSRLRATTPTGRNSKSRQGSKH
ncbi:PREDICTED: uncharacterized protein CXorf65 homolog [Branchiostoma belcheri]|uniref:Uncharacterized protein CXorf65 homolog n=1 Tax=Branchiostoma belcheri TaxID=7741 RepID=A0A6P4YRZ5_BRABE|nr:PREDICTED: uncharacterized protein CXorf65 homolog [Branchiostoma belcheri]KAI8521441.1 hypothetical protein Bbelb_011950 [Branchiostoma belcheri]